MPNQTLSFGQVQPLVTNTADGLTGNNNLGKQNEQLITNIHGRWYYAGIRSNLFVFNVTAVTVPVITSGVVSVFSLYNPDGSGKVLELVDCDVGNLGATVIDVLGVYWQGAPTSDKGTFTTKSVFGTNHFGASPGRGVPAGVPLTSFTHSGTPARIAIIESDNATTVVTGTPIHYDFDGKIVLYPGDVISLVASTGAMTTTSTDLSLRWAEWNVPA